LTTWTGLRFSIVIACLLVSAFFSASETALTGASRASMLRLEKQGNRDAGVVSSLFAMRERMIGALLLGNNIANIGASALATGIFTAWFGEVGVLYATGVMTVLVVIFAEVLPKTIAINAPDRVSLLVARPMKVMVYLLGPLLTIIEAIVRADEDAGHQDRRQPADPVADRAVARRGRSACITRARSRSRTATCSAACWTCASCRSPT
jgi:Mg2+/Co2+ transporter CorB